MDSWSKINWGSRNSQNLGDLGAITDAFTGKFDRGGDSSGFLWEEDSSSKLSGSSDSPLIDLQLGNVYNSGVSEETMIMSSSESVAPSKKVRGAAVVNNQVAYCQVYGCNKDLSSSKDYHKRHKVCDVHSKTSKVIVNGIEQRFCQQCSRFHLLAEFDEGKRSCRKRLAGHNERRRKPQFSSLHHGRAARLLSPYNDGRLQGSTCSAPFICRDKLHGDALYHPLEYGRNDGNYRFEDKTNYNGPVPVNIFHYQQLQPRLSFPCVFEKKPSPNNQTSMFSSTTTPYHQQQEGGGSNSDLSIFDTTAASAIEGFSGISESGCALSLLSSQSQNSSSHNTSSGYNNSVSYGKQNLMNRGVSNGIFLQGSDLNAKDRLLASAEDGGGATTMDLFQLSSQLQRVQHQRQESDSFF